MIPVLQCGTKIVINKIVQQEIVLHIVKQMKMVNIVQDIVEVHKKRSIELIFFYSPCKYLLLS